MLFSYRRSMIDWNVRIGSGVIMRTDCVRFLGVLLDEKLKFDEHIKFITSKMSKTVGILNKVKYFLPDYIMLTLYDAMIKPYLLYAIEIWGSASTCHLDRVFKVQKLALRSVYHLPFNAHTYF